MTMKTLWNKIVCKIKGHKYMQTFIFRGNDNLFFCARCGELGCRMADIDLNQFEKEFGGCYNYKMEGKSNAEE